jgi:hypothetical protein
MPRTVSMKTTHSVLMIGILERRPSASTMPSGSDTAIPTKDRLSVTSSPPHSEVSTCGRPNMPPTSRKKADDRQHKEQQNRIQPFARHLRDQHRHQQRHEQDGDQIGRQRSSIG